MTSGWAAFWAAIAINVVIAAIGYGILRGKVDSIAPIIKAVSERIDEVKQDIRELRTLIMGKQDKA